MHDLQATFIAQDELNGASTTSQAFVSRNCVNVLTEVCVLLVRRQKER